MADDLQLTVVIGSADAASSIERCLESVRRSCRGISAEIIVVATSDDDTATIVARCAPEALLVLEPPESLVPTLWAEGLQHAHGRAVAFTIGQCVVGRDWASGLLAMLSTGVVGAGGRFGLVENASPTTRAVFLLRYSAFLAPGASRPAPVRDIAADNAVYARAALDRHSALLTDGFWEVELHHALRGEGSTFVVTPDAEVTLVDTPPLGSLVRHRFAHGRRFGAWRVTTLGHSRVQIALIAPGVPLALLSRVYSRLIAAGDLPWRHVAAIPAFLLLAASWALGEAVGAVTPLVRAKGSERVIA